MNIITVKSPVSVGESTLSESPLVRLRAGGWLEEKPLPGLSQTFTQQEMQMDKHQPQYVGNLDDVYKAIICCYFF